MKAVLKKALSDVLPLDIIERRKRGFGAPMGTWLQRELRPLRDSLLSRETIEARGHFNWPVVESVCALHDAGREDFTDLLMVMINLELWHRLFVDRRSPADIGQSLQAASSAA